MHESERQSGRMRSFLASHLLITEMLARVATEIALSRITDSQIRQTAQRRGMQVAEFQFTGTAMLASTYRVNPAERVEIEVQENLPDDFDYWRERIRKQERRILKKGWKTDLVSIVRVNMRVAASEPWKVFSPDQLASEFGVTVQTIKDSLKTQLEKDEYEALKKLWFGLDDYETYPSEVRRLVMRCVRLRLRKGLCSYEPYHLAVWYDMTPKAIKSLLEERLNLDEMKQYQSLRLNREFVDKPYAQYRKSLLEEAAKAAALEIEGGTAVPLDQFAKSYGMSENTMRSLLKDWLGAKLYGRRVSLSHSGTGGEGNMVAYAKLKSLKKKLRELASLQSGLPVTTWENIKKQLHEAIDQM